MTRGGGYGGGGGSGHGRGAAVSPLFIGDGGRSASGQEEVEEEEQQQQEGGGRKESTRCCQLCAIGAFLALIGMVAGLVLLVKTLSKNHIIPG